jgi:hypothetical protein
MSRKLLMQPAQAGQNIPQGLKPSVTAGADGTAEAVPFQNGVTK